MAAGCDRIVGFGDLPAEAGPAPLPSRLSCYGRLAPPAEPAGSNVALELHFVDAGDTAAPKPLNLEVCRTLDAACSPPLNVAIRDVETGALVHESPVQLRRGEATLVVLGPGAPAGRGRPRRLAPPSAARFAAEAPAACPDTKPDAARLHRRHVFDVLLHVASDGALPSRIKRALERARFRVLRLREPGALRAVRVDVAVDCPADAPAAARGAATLSAELDGPPPVVSVASDESARAALAGGASEVLSPMVDEVTLSSHIVRLASDRGRRRRRLVLQGSLDDLGLDALFEAVARRGHEARIVLRNYEHHATVVTDGRRILYARVDGETGEGAAVERVRGWADVHFELWARPGPAEALGFAVGPPAGGGEAPADAASPARRGLPPGPAPSSWPPALSPRPLPPRAAAPSRPAPAAEAAPPLSPSPYRTEAPPSSPSPYRTEAPPSSGAAATNPAQASGVALACAVLNAAAAYALVTLPPAPVAAALARSLAEAAARRPGLLGFSVTREGRATVGSLSRAASALPEGLAHWLDLFFTDCEQAAPGRFAPVPLENVLGGLLNMVRNVGWQEALFGARGGS